VCLNPYKNALPPRVTRPNLTVLCQTVWTYGRRTAGKIELTSCLLRSVKIIGTDMDRSAAYDFLSVIHSNTGLTLTVSETNCDFGRKSHFFHPVDITLPLTGFPLELYNGDGSQKRQDGLARLWKRFMVCIQPFRYNTEYRHWTDGTDRQTDRQSWYNNIALCMFAQFAHAAAQ